MCQASQMSEDIPSEDIELAENVRQGGTMRESMRRKQKEEEERGAQVLLWLRYGRVAVIIMLPNEEGFRLNYCFAVVLTCFQLRLDPLYPSSQVDQTFRQTDNVATIWSSGRLSNTAPRLSPLELHSDLCFSGNEQTDGSDGNSSS